MPGNLQAALPSGVMPQTLCTSFVESRIYPMLFAQYHDGTTERGLITDGVNSPVSIRTWKIGKRLKSSDLVALRDFYEGQQGGLTPFYFYVPFEVLPGNHIGSNWDATGANIQGRHTVFFRNATWSETTDIARTVTSLELAEVA